MFPSPLRLCKVFRNTVLSPAYSPYDWQKLIWKQGIVFLWQVSNEWWEPAPAWVNPVVSDWWWRAHIVNQVAGTFGYLNVIIFIFLQYPQSGNIFFWKSPFLSSLFLRSKKFSKNSLHRNKLLVQVFSKSLISLMTGLLLLHLCIYYRKTSWKCFQQETFPQFSNFKFYIKLIDFWGRENSLARGLLVTVKWDLCVFTLMAKNQGPCSL